MSKIALVTGGSRGLGKEMALSLAKKGHDIVLTYLSNKEKAEEVVSEIQALGQKAAALQLDVAKPGTLDAFMESFKSTLKDTFGSDKFDYLVNNAGIGIHAAYPETTEEQFDTLMNIHLKSVFFLTQKSLPIMNDGGSIVNISTGLARFTLPGYDAYAVMKGAVETLTRYQAKTLGQRGINVNALAPGAIETDFGGGAVRDNPELKGFIASQTALGRTGLPDDIGDVVAFLCSDEAKWVTGQRIEASGGMFL
jgi:NAD(P)-dependent dehydrogenase (short-subunit alcohol dehydrogenase family)